MDPLNEVDEDQPNKRQRLCSTNNDIDGKSNTNANDNNNRPVPVRAVYVGGAREDKVHEVNGHFERFGEIESVSIRLEDYWKRSCVVQFKQEEDAAKALQCTEKPWHDFEAKPADPWHQPDHPLNTPPDAESNIVSVLNDNCIQEIFRRLKLLADLTNVAEVCVRFNQQAKVTFASQHKHLNISREFLSCRGLLGTAMGHFGKDIRSLTARSCNFHIQASAMGIIVRYCGPKLKQLELGGSGFQIDLQGLRPIFAGIEQLKLIKCFSNGLNELLASCVELKSLTLELNHGADDVDWGAMKRTYPKLQEFSLHSDNAEDELFESFVIRHPTLIKLSIENTPITSSAYRTIGQHAKNLQELKFIANRRPRHDTDEQIRYAAACIGQLSSLKKLHIDSHSVPFVAVMNALVGSAIPIECLEVWFRGQPIQDNAMECISRLKQIKTLQLVAYHTVFNLTDVHIIGLAENLRELEELHVSDCGYASQLTTTGLRKMLEHATKLKLLKVQQIEGIKIDIDDYKALLSTVQQRNWKVPLVIKIYGKADQVDVPATLLAENRKTLDVEVVRCNKNELY